MAMRQGSSCQLGMADGVKYRPDTRSLPHSPHTMRWCHCSTAQLGTVLLGQPCNQHPGCSLAAILVSLLGTESMMTQAWLPGRG